MSDSRTFERPSASAALGRAWQSVILAALGVFILLGVGFIGSSQIHDAAHDMRHGFNFPCH